MKIILRSIICFSVFFAAALFAISARAGVDERIVFSKDEVPIAYSVYGDGGPVLVFVHGWSCNRSVWREQIPYFEKKYQVVTLDLAGHGASGRQRSVYTQQAFGDDIAAVVRVINGNKVILIGHSMSGTAIIEAYQNLKHSVIGLIGIDTLEDIEYVLTPEKIDEFLGPFKADFAKATDEFVSQMFVKDTDPKLIDEVAAMMSHADPAVGVSALECYFKSSVIPLAPGIDVPLWCLSSDLWPSKPEVNRKYVKSFNLRIIPGCGHFLMLERADEFNKQLDDIIKQIITGK
ncbi:MAG: alpha/beta hydrolase [Candidatus Omnitrophota bacterium]